MFPTSCFTIRRQKQLEVSFLSSWAEEQREVRPENHNCVVKFMMEANAKLVWRPKKDGSIQATKKGQGKLKTRRFLIPKD